MGWLEEPNGKYGRWGQIGESLLVFSILALTIVKVILDWLIGAPDWVLLIAAGVIAVFSFAFGFTVVDEDEDETKAIEPDPDDNLVWKFDRPEGFWGWIRRIVSVWFGFAAMLFIFNELLLKEVFSASESARVWAGFVWLAFVLVVEFLDVVEVEPEANAAPSEI